MDHTTFTLPLGARAILFDLDDTLYDRETAYHTWATAFVQAAFPASDPNQAQEIVALLVKLDEHGYAARETVFAGVQQRYSTLTTPLATLIADYDSAFIAAIEESQAARTLLQALLAAAIPFGIVTNGSPRQQQKIERLGLDRLTSCIFISHFFGAKKPEPAIFLAAAACLGMAPGEILFVGDHPHNDIWGAHRAGMRAAWLRRASSWWPETLPTCADLTLHSLAELL